MGLILPQTVKVRTNGMTCKHYREKGYEFEKCGDYIEVDVFDLPKSSNEKVKVICDVCGKEREMRYCRVVGNNEENKLITCGDKICELKKREDTCTKKYGKGIINVFQAEEVKEKIKNTNLERYGCECSLQNEEIRNKGMQTLKEKYGEGIINVSQVKEIQDKIKNTNLERYGCENSLLSQVVREKIENTNLERYGCKYPFESKEIRNKSEKTWQEKYGKNIKCPLQVESVKDKIKAFWQKNYGEGIINPFQVESIKEKIKATCEEKYGSKSYLSSDDFKNKTRDTWSFNGHDGPCSRQQKYIANLVNGKINEVIAGYWADIYIEKENIVIEYDGGGHFLGDKMNGNIFPTKESILREKEREDKIINNGYKMIRFITTKDRIPSDEVILNLVNEFKNSDFKVIRIDFEKGTIEKDYEEKIIYDFGELRKITQKDLEQFEK